MEKAKLFIGENNVSLLVNGVQTVYANQEELAKKVDLSNFKLNTVDLKKMKTYTTAQLEKWFLSGEKEGVELELITSVLEARNYEFPTDSKTVDDDGATEPTTIEDIHSIKEKENVSQMSAGDVVKIPTRKEKTKLDDQQAKMLAEAAKLNKGKTVEFQVNNSDLKLKGDIVGVVLNKKYNSIVYKIRTEQGDFTKSIFDEVFATL